MKYRFFLTAAIAALVAGSAAQAQTSRTTTGANTVTNGTTAGTVNQFGNVTTSPFTWVPGVGFVANGTTGAGAFGLNQFGANQLGANGLPLFGSQQFAVDPTTGLPITNGFVNNGFNGFDITGGLGTGFYPGYGGYYGYGPAYSGPLVDVRGAWMQNNGVGFRGTGWNGTGIPTLGLNVRPGGVRLPPSRVRVKLTQDPNPTRNTPTTRVAGSRQETRMSMRSESETGEIRGGQVDEKQVKLAGWLGDVMEDRPLREGKVVSLGASGAQVRFTASGEVRTERFPVEEIFFFKKNGELATAATDPSMLRTGSQVLIPQPMVQRPDSVARQGDVNIHTERNTTIVPDSIRESVAGSRQELGEGSVRMKGTVKSRVAGSRQSTRSTQRRPAR